MELRSTPEGTPTSAASATFEVMLEAEDASRAIRRSAEEWRRARLRPLQDALVSARTQESMGANGCVQSSALWIVGWLGFLLLGNGSYDSLMVIPAVSVSCAPFWLVGSGALYLFGRWRRRSVLRSAREQRFELRDPGVATPTWIVRESSRDARFSPETPPQVSEGAFVFPAGARLDAGLAADRHYRTARADRFQRKLGWAAAVERFGRRGCLATGLAAVTVLPCFLLLGADRLGRDLLLELLSAMAIALAVGAPFCTLLVGAGCAWRGWLLRAVRRQALEVQRVLGEDRPPTESRGKIRPFPG